MKAVVQLVRQARVEILQETGEPTTPPRQIGRGFVVLLGVAREDGEADADMLADKLTTLRVFPDDAGKMNLDIRQAGGAFLVVSQFTLLASTRKGRRPSFEHAAEPASGKALYQYVAQRLRATGLVVETGEFGAHMLVELANDGPVTILLDTAVL